MRHFSGLFFDVLGYVFWSFIIEIISHEMAMDPISSLFFCCCI